MSNQQIHVNIDIETLDTQPHAVILSVGATVMIENKTTGVCSRGLGTPYPPLLVHLNMEDQPRRSISRDTLRFWNTLPKDVFDKALPENPGRCMPALYHNIKAWLCQTVFHTEQEEEIDWDSILYWGDPSHFDMGVLNSYFQGQEQTPPWKYHQVRCLDTAQKMLGIISVEPQIPHDPVSDAQAASYTLEAVLRTRHRHLETTCPTETK